MHGDLFPRVPRMLVVKFCLVLGTSVVLANTLVINFVLQFPSQHYSITVAALNATACLATIYGLITIYRYGIRGAHGQSLLYLTLGILFWFITDLTLAYGPFCSTPWRVTVVVSRVLCGSMLDSWIYFLLITSVHCPLIRATRPDPCV